MRTRGQVIAMLTLALALGLNMIFGAFWTFLYEARRSVFVIWIASDVAVLAVVLALALYRFAATDRGLSRYLIENPGSPFILTFVVSLVFAAATYSYAPTMASDIVEDAFLLLIVGVVLQALSLMKGTLEDR